MKQLFYLLFAIWILPGNSSVAQSYTVQVKIRNQPENPVVLGTLKGDEFTPFDTVEVQQMNSVHQEKSIKFSFPENAIPGMYRLVFGQTTYARIMDEPPQQLDFIFNKENIVLETDFNAPADSLKVTGSEENRVWFDFLQREKEFRQKIEELEMEVDYYQGMLAEADGNLTDMETEAARVANEFNQLQLQRDRFISQTADENEVLFASRVIRTFREPVRDGYLTRQEREKSFQKEYFRYLDFSDESLIQTQVFTDKVFDFLVTFNQAGFTHEQREEAYTDAVDIVMRKIEEAGPGSRGSNPVAHFILNYLVTGFERLDMDNVIDFITEKYAGTLYEPGEENNR